MLNLSPAVAQDKVSLKSLPNKDAEEEDDSEWTIIECPFMDTTEDKDGTLGAGISSHFKLDLGWGSLRTTAFSWDLNIRRRE